MRLVLFPPGAGVFASDLNSRYVLARFALRRFGAEVRPPRRLSAHDHFVKVCCGVTIKREYVNMADINFSTGAGMSDTPAPAVRAGEGEPIWDLIELLFFAYRDFVSEPDDVLRNFGFGRAHHRVLHFVNRHPGMKVAELLDVLKITKQSLGRVLKELVDQGYVLQKEGENDRRQRLLFVTPKGEQ